MALPDMNEASTCHPYILPKLKSAGSEDDYIIERLPLMPGRIVPIGDKLTRKQGLRPDYVLYTKRLKAYALPALLSSGRLQSPSLRIGDCRCLARRSQSALIPSILDKAFKGE